MKMLEQTLSEINTIRKKQKVFFMLLIQGLIGSAGKKRFEIRVLLIAKAEMLNDFTTISMLA